MSVSVVVKCAAKGTGEGPHWDAVTKSLLFVDIDHGTIFRWSQDMDTTESIKLDGTVGFVIPCRRGGYVIGHGLNISHVEWSTKKVEVLVTLDQEKEGCSINDAKCDAVGRLLAGTMPPRPPVGADAAGFKWPMEICNLYSIDKDHSAVNKVSKVSLSNGLAWSGDNKILYYIDSLTFALSAYDYNIETGHMENGRQSIKFSVEKDGIPDGMCIDEEDKLWIAFYGTGRVGRYDPITGALLQDVKLPAKRTTSCCFGGKNYDELYVTCAGCGEEEMKETPLAGSLFKVTGLGVKGRPAVDYTG